VNEKPVVWFASSLLDLRAFPAEARRDAGYELHQVQLGLAPSDWRPMSSVGSGVVEIRVHSGGEFRILYVAKFEEAVYVLHAFEKKTRKTVKRDIDLARGRYSALVGARRKGPR
jgi:phage-related protein